MKELFKDIKGYEGYYQVSNVGQIKSLKRLSRNAGGQNRILKERILKLNAYKGDTGCYNLKLYKNKKTKGFKVARLVAQAFLKSWNPKLQVDHINGNRRDNRAENLRMVTNKQNTRGFQKSRGGSSRFRGVNWNKNSKKWMAHIKANGKMIYLGLFDDEKNAALAFNKAATKYKYSPEALNKIENLEQVEKNFKWTKKVKSSRYRGVHFKKDAQKWVAIISVNKKQIYLGRFKDEKDAALAYDQAAIKYGYVKEVLNFQ